MKMHTRLSVNYIHFVLPFVLYTEGIKGWVVDWTVCLYCTH